MSRIIKGYDTKPAPDKKPDGRVAYCREQLAKAEERVKAFGDRRSCGARNYWLGALYDAEQEAERTR